jgi:hypothetical protein
MPERLSGDQQLAYRVLLPAADFFNQAIITKEEITMTDLSKNQKSARFIFIVLVLSALLFSAAGPVTADRPLLVKLPETEAFPANLPVYRLIPPVVNEDTAGGIAGTLGNLNPSHVFSYPTHTGTNQIIVFGEKNGTILEQYEARGGFFAYNPELAFLEIPANLDYGPRTVCNYLASKQLFPDDVLPDARNCDGQNDPPYIQSPIILASIDVDEGTVATQTSTSMVIGEVWQVPLAIEVGREIGEGPLYIPIGGPGGHLSILLTGYDDRPPIDQALPGLQALAIPTHGFSRERIGIFKVIPPGEAAAVLENSLQAGMPGARLSLGEPELIYYLDDPAVEQDHTIPVWYFPDATAIVDGEEVNLRGYTVPAVEGFLPEVTITSPDDGTVYFPGAPIQVAASVISGEPPYDFFLELEDGTPVASGTSSDGEIMITTDPLPTTERQKEGLFLNLEVIDSIGASGMDSLFLESPWQVFVPALLRQASGGFAMAEFYETFSDPQPFAVDAIRSMGSQWIRYYNGHGSNLPATQPDGTGFFNKLKDFGWQGKFHYYNNNAWEKDWRDCSLGGIDCTYGVDRVDFAYFAGHGSPARIYFGVNKDSYNFYAPNARFQSLRWAGFATCQTLRAGYYVSPGNPPLTHWFNSFKGSYMLLGFHSNMKDVAFGPRLVDNMTPVTFLGFPLYQRTIREAWVLTAFQMNAGKPAYLYARSASWTPVNLKLPTASSPDPAPLNPSSISQYLWVWWD